MCNKGRRQSPVNLEPQRLLFDPNLRPLHIDKHRVSIVLNTENNHKNQFSFSVYTDSNLCISIIGYTENHLMKNRRCPINTISL